VTPAKKQHLFRKRCPWCKQWPVIGTNDHTLFWAQCVTADCPVQPITFSAETPSAAVALWDNRKP